MAATARTLNTTGSTSVVLDAIRAAGTISRVGIAQVTGLTGATVSTVVRKLLDAHLVIEIGRAESTGGKPRVLLELNPTARYAVGVHLDHGAITYAVTNLAGAPVARLARPGPGNASPADVVIRMADEINMLVESIGIARDKLLGLGLVSPGPLSSRAGMHLTPPFMRSWEDFPLDTQLADVAQLPVLLENDATAAAIGEYWSGGTQREESFAALYLGTGLGAGIVINGTAYRGTSGNAGEIGHTCANIDGPECWCGARGCFEALAGPAAVVNEAYSDPRIVTAAALDTLGDHTPITQRFAAIARASRMGDTPSRQLLERSARYVGVAAQSVANLLDVRMLVLTGSSFAAASHIYVPAIRDTLAASFFARDNHAVHVQLSQSAETAPPLVLRHWCCKPSSFQNDPRHSPQRCDHHRMSASCRRCRLKRQTYTTRTGWHRRHPRHSP